MCVQCKSLAVRCFLKPANARCNYLSVKFIIMISFQRKSPQLSSNNLLTWLRFIGGKPTTNWYVTVECELLDILFGNLLKCGKGLKISQFWTDTCTNIVLVEQRYRPHNVGNWMDFLNLCWKQKMKTGNLDLCVQQNSNQYYGYIYLFYVR